VPRVLITGGVGFLGSNIADAMSEAGWDVLLLDTAGPAGELPARQEWRQGDVRDARAMRDAVSGCDVVVDNAALVPVTRSTLAEFRSVNVGGCAVTLDAARGAGAYVVHISSSSIYGLAQEMPVREESPLTPFEDYGRSKLEAEDVVRKRREAGQAVASLRARALLGRGRLGLFELIFSRIRGNHLVPMFGRGGNVLQMCDARDFAGAVLACIDTTASGDYNIGSAVYGTVRADLQGFMDRIGSTSRLVPIPTSAIRAALRPLDMVGLSPFTAWHWHASGATFYCSIDKAREELGWEPQYTNVDALERAYDEFLVGTDGASPHSRPLAGPVARVLRGEWEESPWRGRPFRRRGGRQSWRS
jgi:nucleoside-diphosphate-sugar epimerase